MQPQTLQNIVITGASEGIGFETMKALYLTGKFQIVFGSRNMERNQQAKQKILNIFKQKNKDKKPPLLEYIKLDLASRASIQQFVKQTKKFLKKIHILINNAGALFNKKQLSKQLSFEVQKTLLVDYFSVFYLVYLLFNQNLIDIDSKQHIRIVNVSSSAHQYCQNGMFDDLNCESKFYSTYRQYSISKFFLTAFTKQLAKRLNAYYGNEEKLRIKVVALHPGVINTNIGNDVLLARIIKFVARLWMKSHEEGAQSSIALSQADFKDLVNGGYYNEVGKLIKADKRTDDPQIRERLWELSEKGYGVKFQI